MKNIIFTDGSSRGNPGPGGWGAIIVSEFDSGKSKIIEIGGGDKFTTNNKMELTSAIEALSLVPINSDCTIFTDSSYLVNGITKWIYGWKKNGWKTKDKEDVSNKDLWIKLSERIKEKNIIWKHIRGHVGVVGNERCDQIATFFADEKEIELFNGNLSDYSLPNILDVSHNEEKKSEKRADLFHSRAKAYSYVSSVGGIIEIHQSWPECEKRVKGAKGAKYKKAVSVDDEKKIIEDFKK